MKKWFILLILIPLKFYGKNEDSRQCISVTVRYESRYNIPSKLLHSIAIIESGRTNDAMKQVHPWPWTVNVAGQPHYFDDKDTAIKFVEDKLKQGIKNMDIGCNQVNCHHHGKHFQSVAHAFNPQINSEYAAKFLRNHFNTSQNWILAVGRHHSFTTSLSKVYAGKVFKVWKKHLYKRYGWHDRTTEHTTVREIKQPKKAIHLHDKIMVFSKGKTIESISKRMTSQY